MFHLIDVRKADNGLAFDNFLAIEANLKERNPDILKLENVRAKGQIAYDDGFYVLDYCLTYQLTLPSSRSLKPVVLDQEMLVNEVFIERKDFASKADLVEENLVLILEEPVLDLEESVLDNILLNIPLQVLTPEEEAEDNLPSGKDWQVLSQEAYEAAKVEKREANSPFAALNGLFDAED